MTDSNSISYLSIFSSASGKLALLWPKWSFTGFLLVKDCLQLFGQPKYTGSIFHVCLINLPKTIWLVWSEDATIHLRGPLCTSQSSKEADFALGHRVLPLGQWELLTIPCFLNPDLHKLEIQTKFWFQIGLTDCGHCLRYQAVLNWLQLNILSFRLFVSLREAGLLMGQMVLLLGLWAGVLYMSFDLHISQEVHIQ